MKKLTLLLTLLVSITVAAQHGYRDGNRIGITAGVTQTSLMTSNFNAKPELGWAGGMSVRGNYYNDSSMIFGMQFFENNFSLETNSLQDGAENLKYKAMGVQIRLLYSYNIVKNHVSIDLGPVLQINDKLKISKKDELNNIVGTNLRAGDILDVTKINGNLYAGIAAGNRRVRAIISYQYGLNNFLNNLNKKQELKLLTNNTSFKGHLGIISGQLLFNL